MPTQPENAYLRAIITILTLRKVFRYLLKKPSHFRNLRLPEQAKKIMALKKFTLHPNSKRNLISAILLVLCYRLSYFPAINQNLFLRNSTLQVFLIPSEGKTEELASKTGKEATILILPAGNLKWKKRQSLFRSKPSWLRRVQAVYRRRWKYTSGSSGQTDNG